MIYFKFLIVNFWNLVNTLHLLHFRSTIFQLLNSHSCSVSVILDRISGTFNKECFIYGHGNTELLVLHGKGWRYNFVLLDMNVHIHWGQKQTKVRFLYLSTVDIFGQMSLCCGGVCPVPGLYPLDVSRILSRDNNYTCLQNMSNIPWETGGMSTVIKNKCSKYCF